MELNQNEPVVQAEKSGALPVEAKLSKPENDWRKDMLKYKDRVSELETALKEKELTEQQKKGNLEGVITSLKDELKTTKAEHSNDRYEFANSQIDNAVTQEVLSRGLVKEQADILVKLLDKDEKGRIEFGEGFQPVSEDVKDLVDKNMERYSTVFTKDVKIADGIPKGKGAPKNKVVDTNAMSSAELKEYIINNEDKLK